MSGTGPIEAADRNFVLQQGLEAPARGSCSPLSAALRFQPKAIGLILLTGMISQSSAVFAVLAGLLWWSSLLPRWNPFDFAYNRTLGLRPGAPALGPAPMPRRFAQGLAAAFASACAAGMSAEFWLLAWGIQTVLLAAVAALVFGRFCLGSLVYHLLRGRLTFAIETLPWGPGA